MQKWLMKRFALTDDGARDTQRAILKSFLVSLAGYLPATLLLLVVDGLALGHSLGATFYIVAGIIVAVIIFVLLWIEYDAMYDTTYKESAKLRIGIAELLNELPLSYFSRHDTADLSQTIMSDVEAIEHAMSHSIPKFGAFLFSFPLVSIMVISYDWRMGLTVVIPIVVGYGLIVMSKRMQTTMNKRYYLKLRANADHFQEAIENAQEIHSYHLGPEMREEMDRCLDETESLHIKSEVLAGLPLLSSSIIMQLSIALVILLGTGLLASGSIDILTLVAYVIVALKLKEGIDGIAEAQTEIYYLDPRIERIEALRSVPIQKGEDADLKTYDIELKDVWFKYDEADVLTGVDFTAHQDQVTALVGHSGSGKTSILRLVSRLYDYDGGSIKIDGKDISELSTKSLFAKVSIVFQDVTLFDTTIRENIRIGKEGATDEEVERAAHLANCDAFIAKLKDGYDTVIGENGATLSGGERQRLSIARAFLKDAPIIILDEIASALDVENEKAIQESLKRLIAGKTVIIISHRLKSIEHVDQIVVIADGKVERTGKHQELLATSPTYRRLVDNAQAAEVFRY